MTEIFIKGTSGRLQGNYFRGHSDMPSALLLHSHPLQGGSISTELHYSIYRRLVQENITTLTFNFAGVERSEGQFTKGVGELTDAAIALDELQSKHDYLNECYIIGVGFGAWIGMQLIMRRPEVSNFIAIAPPIKKYDFSFIQPSPVRGLIIQGNLDSVTLSSDLEENIDKFNRHNSNMVQHKIIDQADSCFRDKIEELNQSIVNYIESRDTSLVSKKQPGKMLL